MFDLNEAVRSWRLSFSESMLPRYLDELEEHLRTEVETLESSGLSPEEAFLVAGRRLGGKSELEREYAKVHGEAIWVRRVQWMVLGFLGINALLLAFRVLGDFSALFAVSSGMQRWGIVGALASVRLIGILTVTWVFVRLSRGAVPRGGRLVLVASLLALATPLLWLGPVIAKIEMTRLGSELAGTIVTSNAVCGAVATVLLPLVFCLVVYSLERRQRTA